MRVWISAMCLAAAAAWNVAEAAPAPLKQALQSAPPKHPLVVILDPGHGGEDKGTVQKRGSGKIAEKDLTLALAHKTADLLRRRGILTILTRSDDSTVSLFSRAMVANRAAKLARQAIFLSIHANSSPKPESSGMETYVFNAATNEASRRLAQIENGKFKANASNVDLILTDLATTANYGDSVSLAQNIHETVVQGLRQDRFPIKDRGVRRALFYILMQNQMPSVLLEPGFASNPRELEHMMSPRYQYALASNIAEGVVRWSRFHQ